MAADGTVLPLMLTQAEADDMLKEMLEGCGCAETMCQIIYRALGAFGNVAFTGDEIAAAIPAGLTHDQLLQLMQQLRG